LRKYHRLLATLGALSTFAFFASGIAQAQTLRPQISQVIPPGGQRGVTTVVTLTGVNLGFGTALVAENPALMVESIAPEAPPANAKNPDGKIVVKFKVSADATPGRYPFRVMTPFGPSELGYFVVGEWPENPEKEPNNLREQAQPLTFPTTVNGRSDSAEDVDIYKVTIQRGETMVFSVAAGSIGSAMTPVIRLLDVMGKERAFAAALNQPDATLTFTAPQTGDYFLYVRDLRYQGGAGFFYRLTAGRIPAISDIFPMGGRAGQIIRVALTGTNLPPPSERLVTLPSEPLIQSLPLPDVGNRLLDIGNYPEYIEVEPNDTPENAGRVTPPVTVNGRVFSAYSTRPDVDCFRFSASKGQVFSLEVLSARLGSSLDPVLSVMDIKGKELVANDDARGKDPALSFTVPETGDYIARVSDLRKRPDTSPGYRLRIAPSVPDFTLRFYPDCPAVAPGDRTQLVIAAERQNGFDGDVTLSINGLPAGMRVIGKPVIAKGQNAVTLLITADAGSVPVTSPLRISGTATLGGRNETRFAQSHLRTYVKRDDRIEETTRPVRFPFATVTGPSDVIIRTATEAMALVIGKTVECKITVERKAGYAAKIPILIQGLPANITVTGAEIPENKNETTVVLKAETAAQPGSATLTIVARCIVDELRFTDHVALPVNLTIAK
jgi:hypothetical protein